jgi:primosomal protein N' (replication factor Y) (superfamily II helicase)
MNFPFCNVALPVPLRMTFTYAVPEELQGQVQVQPGARVLVPFRKKSLVGVITELLESAPPETKIRPISKLLELQPALTPKLIELGQWIANYYLAPVGEVFRAMLPPLTGAHRPFSGPGGIFEKSIFQKGASLGGAVFSVGDRGRRITKVAAPRLSGNS